MLVAMIDAIVAAAAALTAFMALRMSLRMSATSAATTTAMLKSAATTSAPEDNHKGMWRSHRDTSLESSVLPVGSVRTTARARTTTINAKIASNASVGRRTRFPCEGEWTSSFADFMCPCCYPDKIYPAFT
jgi:hypothetical protein